LQIPDINSSTGMSLTKALRVTKKLLLYKIEQVQATEDENYKTRKYFLLLALVGCTQNLFFIAKAWFHLSINIDAENER
jgi:hypothetical protein